jgi:hypothetical protein
VKDRAVHVAPFRELRIDRVVAAGGLNAAVTIGSTVRILGRQLGSPDARVLINGIDVTSNVVSRAREEIQLSLAPTAGLRAGPCGVQIVQPVAMGNPPALHDGFASNVATFVLSPDIDAVAGDHSVDITCSPPVATNQRVQLLLNQSDASPGTLPRAYSFAAPTGNGVVPPATETSVIHVPITNVAPGRYLVRLQVDGAQSPLTMSDGSAVFDQPALTL